MMLALCTVAPAVARAQQPVVHVGSHLITVDHGTNVASVRLTNTSADSVHVHIVTQYAQPPLHGKKTTADDASAADSAKWSLASWLQDVPPELTLAPHETRTVTLHVRVPSGIAPGDYSTYVTVVSPLDTVKSATHEQGHEQEHTETGKTVPMDSAVLQAALQQMFRSANAGGGKGMQVQIVTSDGQQVTLSGAPQLQTNGQNVSISMAGSGAGASSSSMGMAPNTGRIVYHVGG